MSNFYNDLNTEKEISRFIDQYLYPKLGPFLRHSSKQNQQQGIDVTLELNQKDFYIDDKCAIYYANKPLNTFTFELSFNNKKGETRPGWLVNKEYKTTHYNIMWLTTKDKKLSPKNIKKDDISSIESMLVSRSDLFDYLEREGFDVTELIKRAESLRQSTNNIEKLTNSVDLIRSPHLKEEPINVKIKKSELKKISDLNLKITSSSIIDLKRKVPYVKSTHNYEEPFGVKAEKIVYEAVKNHYLGDEGEIYKHFPLHNHRGGRREIDILTIDRESGVTIFEVKGIRMNQITAIEGKDWHVKNYFLKEKINPYRQAELQMNELSEYLERHDLLHNRFTKRIVIALPYITRKEWEGRGYHKVKNLPPVLLKDELESHWKINKVKDFYLKKAHRPLNNEEWNLMKKSFYLEHDNVYSSLYVLSDLSALLRKEKEIVRKLEQGIKVSLLCYFNLPSNWLQTLKEYVSIRQLEIFTTEKKAKIEDVLLIEDGESALPNYIKDDFSDFNHEQYKVIHTPIEEHLMVTAGAGTGKTHVMIDRILFLLANHIDIKDIHMITFTNDSTSEMKRRLQEKLIRISKLTGQSRFNEYAEDVKAMQISTIHSYTKSILKALAHELGYGKNISQRGFIYDKSVIINELIDEFYQEHGDYILTRAFSDYELEKQVRIMWEEMGKKGLSPQEIEVGLDWGSVTKTKAESLQKLFQYVFARCETRLDQLKREENTVAMNDLVRKMKELSEKKDALSQLDRNKFLFIDEFQDSDNVQIDFVANLAKNLDYKLFIVGDVKQSIYRFRGADYKSFDLIKQKITKQDGTLGFTEVELNKNYRTTPSLLEKLHPLFLEWSRRGWLTYDDKLLGLNGMKEAPNEFELVKVADEQARESTIVEAIKESLKTMDSNSEQKNQKIGIIVRTNTQAKQIADLCKQSKIPTFQNLDGTFYMSDAVRDFKHLIDGLLFPNQAMHLINALQSPYFRYQIPYQLLLPLEGDNEGILRFINDKIGDDFNKYVKQLRTLPVMAVIQKIISENKFFSHLKSYYKANQQNETDLNIFLKQYQNNLFHLMDIIQQQFGSLNGTLYQINNWLSIQMRTNRQESEPMIKSGHMAVEITTVHRAKGLEYHTVIIPNTNFSFNKNKNITYIDEEVIQGTNRKIGWYFEKMNNNHYQKLEKINQNEVIKEEVRLLYVALTRVIERLFIIMPKRAGKDTWADLIKETGVEVKEQ